MRALNAETPNLPLCTYGEFSVVRMGKESWVGNLCQGRLKGGDVTTISTEAPERPNQRRPPSGMIRSLIPARLDRLGWSRFHTRLVVALGVAWVLDGLEITIASNAEGLISQKQALNLSSSQVAFAVGTVYLLGEVVGALFFGRMSDKFGRRNLFMITLGVYLFGGVLTALTFGHSHGWSYWVWVSRFIAGMGIGGEYAAIDSAIDELIPAKYRGRVDIAVNGTYWGGALIATLFFIFVINHLPVSYSWRIAFLVGPALGFVILFVRKNLPESPRWLLMHGREQEAEAAVAEIEELTKETGGTLGPIDESKAIEITPANNIGFVALTRTLFVTYPRRAILGASLMITPSFSPTRWCSRRSTTSPPPTPPITSSSSHWGTSSAHSRSDVSSTPSGGGR